MSSLEPRIMTEKFIAGLAGLEKVCPHFHLSLQSECDATLRRMNRHYTTAEYAKSVELLRRYYDRPAITTDVIVGFPGETGEEFEQTCAFLEKIGFMRSMSSGIPNGRGQLRRRCRIRFRSRSRHSEATACSP